jgi:ABC-2 type transport system ATP-binding protein
VRELLIEMRRRFGTTVVLTTHNLKDISTTCERLLVLDQGRLLYDGDLQGFQRKFARERSVLVDVVSEPDAEKRATLERSLGELEATSVWETPRRLRVTCARAGSAPRVTSLLLSQLEVEDLSLAGTEIETLVAELYRGEGRAP